MTDCSPIKLIISGKERAGLKTRKRDQMILTQAERRFYSVTIPLRTFQEHRRIQPGEYTLPFSIKIPKSLPSSDSHPTLTRKKVGYSIQYRMTAKMGKLYRELYFDVNSAPLRPERIPCLIRPTQHRIQSMGMKEEGQVVLGAMVRNSIVGRGRNIELILACRNDSAVNIRCVEIQIIEYLRWTLGPKPETTDVSKALKTIKSVELPSSCRARFRSEVGKRPSSALYREIHEELRSRREPILIRVPDTARDTYRGQLVNVWHCLKISFLTRSLSTNATAVVPIQIGSPPLKRPNKHSKPAPEAHPLSNMTPVTPGHLSAVPEDGEDVGSTVVPRVVDTDDMIILGSATIHRTTDLSSVVTAPPEPVEVEVSLKSLLTSMRSTVNDFDLIQGYLGDRRWVKFFSRLSPPNFGKIIHQVKVEVDQTRVAVLLAPHLNGGKRFTCQFAAAAIKNCAVPYRSVTTKRLLPVCFDLKENHQLILNELNEWERIATSNEFEEALSEGQ